MKTLSLLLVDDHALFRSGIAMVLSTGLANVRILEAGALEEALALTDAPDLVLLDLQLPGLSGMDGMPLMRVVWPDAQLVVVSAAHPDDVADKVKTLGARAFISKTEKPAQMLELVSNLLGLGLPAVTEAPPLTPRQLDVLRLLHRGLSNKAIGKQLGLSENTVRGHVQALLVALEVSSRSQAAFRAQRLKLVD
ncbi:response regulator transcription factor [Pseudomonas kurunegalensis]|uniref:response regulator transcription factor n=1 Tax=Pseudomonas kurunegalensis TaxID=485880 RepID=UPI00256FC1CA|nr:response regulator transcription factor [Pseudomonas kurunegalensis]WJD60329.1 response regulator transcription factor [Pseudomonas kurunegalensis]